MWKAEMGNLLTGKHVVVVGLGRIVKKLIYLLETKKVFRNDDPLAFELARDMNDLKNLAYYRKMARILPASILLRSRGEVLEEKNIKRSKGAMFAFLVKKHTARMKALAGNS